MARRTQGEEAPGQSCPSLKAASRAGLFNLPDREVNQNCSSASASTPALPSTIAARDADAVDTK